MAEQETFPYLSRYMNCISKKIPEIESEREKLKNFALAGLFLTYRAFNHSGDTMTTEIENTLSESIHLKRLKAFKEYFGIKIMNTEHYFSMLNLSKFDLILMMFRLSNLSRKLYNFVVK
ncbi:MAG TPA: hypothetical protein VGB68_01175 [Pyrinomonadaceae bacterium]